MFSEAPDSAKSKKNQSVFTINEKAKILVIIEVERKSFPYLFVKFKRKEKNWFKFFGFVRNCKDY